MTGFLCRSIFRVHAEILIFGEIYTSGVGDKFLVHVMIWKSNKEMWRWHRDWSLECSMVTSQEGQIHICHCSVFSASLLKFDKK